MDTQIIHLSTDNRAVCPTNMKNIRYAGHYSRFPDDRVVSAIKDGLPQVQGSTSADIVGIDPPDISVQRLTETRSEFGEVLPKTCTTSIEIRNRWKTVLRFIPGAMLLGHYDLNVLLYLFLLHIPLTPEVQPWYSGLECKHKNIPS